MRLFGSTCVFLGITLIALGWNMPLYEQEELFWREVNAIGTVDPGLHFHLIQQKFISAKYSLMDYGFCAFLLGIFLLYTSRTSSGSYRSPKAKWLIIAIGIAALVLTLAAYYGSVLLEINRHLYPPWVSKTTPSLDSLQSLALFLLSWLALHCITLREGFLLNRSFKHLSLDFISLGLLSSTIISAGLLVVCWVGGQPLYVVPLLLWTYFHLSILVGKQSKFRMEK